MHNDILVNLVDISYSYIILLFGGFNPYEKY